MRIATGDRLPDRGPTCITRIRYNARLCIILSIESDERVQGMRVFGKGSCAGETGCRELRLAHHELSGSRSIRFRQRLSLSWWR